MTEERLPLQKVMVSLPSVRHNFGSHMTKNVTKQKTSEISEVSSYGGSERHRSADLTIFSRSLYQLSYRAMNRNLFERPRPDLNR